MTRFFAGLRPFSVRFRWPLPTVILVRAFPYLASVAKDSTGGFSPPRGCGAPIRTGTVGMGTHPPRAATRIRPPAFNRWTGAAFEMQALQL